MIIFIYSNEKSEASIANNFRSKICNYKCYSMQKRIKYYKNLNTRCLYKIKYKWLRNGWNQNTLQRGNEKHVEFKYVFHFFLSRVLEQIGDGVGIFSLLSNNFQTADILYPYKIL